MEDKNPPNINNRWNLEIPSLVYFFKLHTKCLKHGYSLGLNVYIYTKHELKVKIVIVNSKGL